MAYRKQTVVGQGASALVQNGLTSGLIQWDSFDPLSLLPNDDYSTVRVYVLISSKTEHFATVEGRYSQPKGYKTEAGRLPTGFEKPFQFLQGEVSSALIS
jgi:hypothetical protein